MKAEVRQVNGVPELFVNDRRMPRGIGRLAEPGFLAPEKLDQYREAGIQVFITSIFESNKWCWDGAGGYDYEDYEAHFAAILRKKPDALLIPFVGGVDGAPYLWCRANEEELVLQDTGVRLPVGSFASAKWWADSCDAIRRFVEHFEAGPFAENIIGYNPVLMNHEWMVMLDKGGYADFSEPMRRRFWEWLREYYRGDEARLRQAWRDDRVTFATAEIPDGAAREDAGHPEMFHIGEVGGTRVADYYRCHNDLVAEMFLAYCGAIKTATARQKLAGGMIGYQYGMKGWQPNSTSPGHNAVAKLMSSPHVDFFHGPYNYLNRCHGGTHQTQFNADSVLLHGKLMLDQIDTKTDVHLPPNTNAKTPWETEHILRRDVAHSLTKNCHHYWYEMTVTAFLGQNAPTHWRGLTYDRPDIRRWIARLEKLTDENQRLATQPVAEVAWVTSADSDYYRRPTTTPYNLFVEGLRAYFLPYIGAPFEDYAVEDLPLFRRRHKVYIFPNAWYIPAPLRVRLHQWLADAGATALWFYAPGYVDETGYDLDHIRQLTGITVRKNDAIRDFLQCEITDTGHPFTRGLTESSFGSDIDPMFFQSKQEWAWWFSLDREDHKLAPVFYADDPTAQSLGRMRGVAGSGLAIKQMERWRSVYCGAPFLPPKLLSNILADAGVHLYSRTQDQIYANNRFIGFCCNGDGPKTLYLPARADLYDALTNDCLGRAITEWKFEARHGETKMFAVEPGGPLRPRQPAPGPANRNYRV